MTPAANFATSFARVVDTGGKFATCVNDTGGKLATGVKKNNTSGKLPPVNDTGGKFTTGVNDTGGKQWEQLSDC
jgi:hypothetical protein